MDRYRFRFPRIFLFCQDVDSSLLVDDLNELVAVIVPVSPDEVEGAVREMTQPDVVACVFEVSHEFLSHTAFQQALQAARNELGRRKEFRLFVHLADTSRRQLIDMAQTIPAAADLLDSVHIGESSEQGSIYNLTLNIAKHLKQLPAILDYQKYERWQRFMIGLVPYVNAVYMVVLGIGWWQWSFHTQQTQQSSWFPWILCGIGSLVYLSLLCIGSFGSTLRTGGFFRWVMALSPMYLISIIPSSAILVNWLYLAAGIGAGALLDAFRRMWAQSRREQIPVDPPTADEIKRRRGAVGGRHWQMLTTAPILSSDPEVFISYSRASDWGSAAAAALHDAVQAAGLPSFLDVKGIAEGTSWRHKLQQVIGKASVFISVQDSLTAARHWPSAELNAAMRSQEYCGLPSIIILRNASLADGVDASAQPTLVGALLSQKGEVDPTLLRIIDYKEDTIGHLAQGLTTFEPPSVINTVLGVLIGYALRPIRVILAVLGVVGASAGYIAGFAWMVCNVLGVNVEKWLNSSGLGLPTMLLIAFWIGFVIRLVFSSRFELRAAEAPQVYWIHLGAVLIFLWMFRLIAPAQPPLSLVFAVVLAGFAFLSACDFVSRSLPESGYFRAPIG